MNSVEAERDQWQRPFDVVQALALKPGNVVVDLGCGSGYFALKHLPPHAVNPVLIANTYREFTDSRSILVRLCRSLVPGGRLVVVDRQPQTVKDGSGETPREHHEISSEQVEDELRRAGFQIVDRQDRFIEKDPSNEAWWLIVTRKP